MRSPIFCYSLVDRPHRIPSHPWELANNLVVRFCPFLPSLAGYFQWSEKSRHRERSREALHSFVLFGQERHVGPMIVDVGDAMCRQHTWLSLAAAQGLPDAIPFNNGGGKADDSHPHRRSATPHRSVEIKKRMMRLSSDDASNIEQCGFHNTA